jgi:hypothetical protein
VSAYILDKDTIDLMVSAGLRGNGYDATLRVFWGGEWHNFSRYENADELGQILHDQNVRSVNYRYDEATPTERYRYSGEGIAQYLGGSVIPWGAVFGACHCYQYQSCETGDYYETLAHAITQAIVRKVCNIIAEQDGSPWGWSREDATQRLEEIKAGVRVLEEV